jgi:hypothetical protein
MLLDRGPVPVPVLHRGGFVRCGHVQVGPDERVAIDGVDLGELADRQGALVRVQGAAPPRPGISADLAREKADPADQQPSRHRPPVRAVLGDGDLRTVHLARLDPVALAQALEDPPQRGDAPRADGEPDLGEVRSAGQLSREVAGIRAKPKHRGPRRGGQRLQGPAQQLRGGRAGIPSPAIKSAASTVPVSAQDATCGHPHR